MNKPKMASATKTRCGGLWVPEEAVTRFPRGAGKGFAGRERKRQRGTRQTPVLRRRGWRKWPVVAGSWSVECRGGGGRGEVWDQSGRWKVGSPSDVRGGKGVWM